MIVPVPQPPRVVVRNTLEANGFGWIENPALDPSEDWTNNRVLHSRTAVGFETDPFVPALASYEFRKLLRHLIGLRGEPICDLARIATRLGQSVPSVERAFSMLIEAGLLDEDDACYRFLPTVDSLGPTVEWFVSGLFNGQLHWDATTNVLLEDTEYNDFDVIAVHGGDIAHVECKTSAPTRDGISDDELVALAGRHYFLQPTFTLLLVDTSSSVQDLAQRVGNALLKHLAATAPFTPIDSAGNVLNGARNVYVASSSTRAANGLLKTLQLTLRHHRTQVRQAATYG